MTQEESDAVKGNRMISAKEERIRQVVGATLAGLSAIKYAYMTIPVDYASLSAGLAVGVGVWNTGVRSQ